VKPDEFVDPELRALVDAVAHTGRLVRETIHLPGSDSRIDVIRPCDLETLLDQSADDPEQNLPYWAEIWPSGVGLASAIIGQPELIAGQPVLELGSGVGITAAVAVAEGAELVATDYAPESLILTRITSRLHTGREPWTRRVNWRSLDADLLQADGSRWPVILAADVLYEQRDVGPILEVFDRIVAPGGLVWLADQDRAPANAALKLAASRGWRITSTSMGAAWPDLKDAGVIVRVHQMRRPGRP
jgi:predicted nicotinamide N-methyase